MFLDTNILCVVKLCVVVHSIDQFFKLAFHGVVVKHGFQKLEVGNGTENGSQGEHIFSREVWLEEIGDNFFSLF